MLPARSEKRIVGLDGLRAISLLLVLQAHWEPSAAFGGLTNWGRGGLIVFFVISGFLITGILVDLRDQVDDRSRTWREAIKNFYARRSLRILPIYYLVLAFVVWRDLCPATTQDWLWHSVFLNNLSAVLLREHVGVYGPTAPWWSLAVEEQFYILWAPVLLLAPRRILPWLLGAMIVSGIGFRFETSSILQIPFVVTLGNIDSLAAGAAVALIVRTPLAGSALFRRLASACLTVAAGVLTWMVITSTQSTIFGDVVWYALFAPLVFLLAVQAYPKIGPLLDNRVMQFIGRRSYGAYILQQVVAYSIFIKYYPSLSLSGTTEFCIYFPVTMILASLSYRFFEMPIQKMRETFFPKGADHPILLGSRGSLSEIGSRSAALNLKI